LGRRRELADRAARTLYDRIRARRFELLDELHGLNRLELRALEAGPDHPATWDALALVYRERPGVLAELAILENGAAADLLRFLSSGADERQAVTDRILRLGGLPAKRRMDCFHCCTSVPPDRRNVGRCSGPCWRRCSGTCLVCGGSGAVLCETLIEVTVSFCLANGWTPTTGGVPRGKGKDSGVIGALVPPAPQGKGLGMWELDAASFVGGSAGLARQRLSEKDQV
jgi:hypothetical protein